MHHKKNFLTKKRGKAGFTLVELMVTMVIISIIGIFSFAIMFSSLNTFDKQKELVDAVAVKNMVFDSIKGFIQNKRKVIVTMTNTIDVTTPDKEIIINKSDPDNPYITDSKLVNGGVIFSYGGRIYVMEQPALGKYFINKDDEAPKDADVNGFMGKTKLLDDVVYKGYDVTVTFMPFFTIDTSKYQDLKVIVSVTDPKQNNIEVAYGYQYIHMLNIENAKGDIEFRNTNVSDKTPGDTPYFYCYYQ